MVKCTFCGNELQKSTGKTYVKADGKIFYFCSMKCEKNQLKLKRKGRNVKWTKIAAAEKTKAKATAKASAKK